MNPFTAITAITAKTGYGGTQPHRHIPLGMAAAAVTDGRTTTAIMGNISKTLETGEDRERLEAELAHAVELFNASSDPAERIELIREIRGRRALLERQNR